MKARQIAAKAALILLFILPLRPDTAFAAGIEKGPYLQRPTLEGITICWVSDADAKGVVRVGPATGGALNKTVNESEAAQYHKVRVTGLKPGASYRYEVQCGDDKKGDSFRTAVPPGKPFNFVAYGDNRGQADKHALVLARMMKSNPMFAINTGDIVANGTQEPLWTEFFQVAGEVLSRIPYYPALGNHERDGLAYLKYFDVPRDYSFDYGNAHFVAIDTNRPAAELPAQNEWLKKDLAAHQDATWRIVFCHHTPYTCVLKGGRREIAEVLRARIEPILVAGRVQVMFNGHDHDYQHHFARGIHYVVTGGGGAPLYEVKMDTPFVKAAKMAHHLCEVSVNGSKMTIRAVEPDGSVIEQFVVDAADAQ